MPKKSKAPAWLIMLLALFKRANTVFTYEEVSSTVNRVVPHVRKYLEPFVMTSLNKKRTFVTTKRTVKKNCDHYGFYRHEQTGAVFHIEGEIKATLLYLIKKIDWGITEAEARKMCSRECYRTFNALLESGTVVAARIYGELVYFHPDRQTIQLRNRLTNRKFQPKPSKKGQSEKPILMMEEVLKTLRDQEGLSPELVGDLCLIFLQYYEQQTYRGLETRLLLDARLREMLNFPLHEVPDHTTIWRVYDQLTVKQLQELFQLLLGQLQAEKIVNGRYLVVDATHIFAWANTHKTIYDGDIPGAAWGEHHGYFYGYKVHILIDAEAELPVAVILTPGNEGDHPWLIPLLADAKNNIDLDGLQGIFGDAGYYVQGVFEKACSDYQVTLNADINPRRSKFLKTIKADIRQVFAKHGDKIQTVDDALKLMPQKLITSYTNEVGSTRFNMIAAAIRERLQCHLRSAVERVFSRAKQFFWLERPRTRDPERVKKHVLFGFCAMHLVSLTAARLGFDKNRLAFSRVC